jgi:Fe-S-cluster-containing hydrogenase component 2
MIACSSINEGIGDLNISRIKVTPFWSEAFFVPRVCQQCNTPYCALVCPVNALNKDLKTGVVKVEKNKCVGCKMCLMGCPFGNMTFVGSTSAKCDSCGGDPVCVKVCCWGALEYGDANEIGTARRLDIAERQL